MSEVFHLNSKEAKRAESQLQQRKPAILLRPKHLGVTLDKTLTCRKADITSRTLEAAHWFGLGCWANNMAKSHLIPGPFNSRVHCIPAWCRSAHTRLIDPVINDAL